MTFDIVGPEELRRGKPAAAPRRSPPVAPVAPVASTRSAFEFVDPDDLRPEPADIFPHYENVVSRIVDHLLPDETRARIRAAEAAYDEAHVAYCDEVRRGTKAPITETLWWRAHDALVESQRVWTVAWGGKVHE